MKIDEKQLEKYSSAITLSDMEIFVFPELMYSLVLANIMSPIIWQWRQKECFKKLEGKTSYKKLMRLKQFIMDEYEFNLDLETWGLTSQDKELSRFTEFISPEQITQSNALFGYHGDRYYFDVDIRRHFGLDKYNSDIIPYWKTETVEAMDAFGLKQGYKTGAGECVSLSALYAAAAFVVCQIPLEDIYMILTPLHSQNFIDINNGVLTNNRRLVTKTMWFNGTAISDKAQRALRNERVTIIAHNTGIVHCLYDDATMNKNSYNYFIKQLEKYLSADLTTLILTNFLRFHSKYQKYFQFCCEHCRGGKKFAKAEVLFHYEHGSTFRIADDTFEKLLNEVSNEDILLYKLVDRMCAKEFGAFIKYENINIKEPAGQAAIKKHLKPLIAEPDIDDFLNDLIEFMYTKPMLPENNKNFVPTEPIKLSVDHTREDIIDNLQQIRSSNTTADLAFYVYRDMESCDWTPFVKAAVERNPVSIEITDSMSIEQVYKWLEQMENISIYDNKRLATPDEAANYNTADGLEKAFLLANIIRKKTPEQNIEINVNDSSVILKADGRYSFESVKKLSRLIKIPAHGKPYST